MIDVASRGFAGALLVVRRYQRTGVMEVQADQVTTFVYVEQGVPVFAESSALGDAFGRVLLQQNSLSPEQYAEVIQKMTDAPIGSEQMRFGEVAVALGFLTHEQVNDALEAQVRQRVLHCFQWPAPDCRFDAAIEALDEVAHYPLDVEPLVLEGVRRFYDFGRTDQVLGACRDRYATLEGSSMDVGARFRMKPNEIQFLEEVNGRGTIDQLLTHCRLDPLHGAQILTALILADGVILDTERQVNSMEMRALNVSKVTVKNAPAPAPAARVTTDDGPRISQRPPPKVARRPEPAAKREGAPAARPSLPPPGADVKKRRLQAEVAFRKGKKALLEDLHGKALKELQRAHALHPEAVEYEIHAAWVELVTSRDQAVLGDLRERLADLVRRGVQEDANMAFAHYVKGHLELKGGDERMAMRCFRRASRLEPENQDAQRQLRVLAQRFKG